MANRRKAGSAYQPERYNRRTVHDEREYGFFWYDWLWKILRPIVVFLCSLLIVVGMATVVWNKVNEKLLLPVDPPATRPRNSSSETATPSAKSAKSWWTKDF